MLHRVDAVYSAQHTPQSLIEAPLVEPVETPAARLSFATAPDSVRVCLMTATAPSVRTDASGRADTLRLVAALLLAVSGLFALPAELFSQMYYLQTRDVLAVAAPASVLTTLTLVAVAVARGSRTFLLVMTAGAALHLAALVALSLAADAGLRGTGLVWFGPAELVLALVALALAGWNTMRASSQWVPLLLLALAPPLGRYISGAGTFSDTFYLGSSWGSVLAAALAVSLSLTILAAGLVCLPGRGAQISGAVLIVLAGLSLFVTDLVLGRSPDPYRLPVVGLALVCAVAAIIAGRHHGAAAGADTTSVPATDGSTEITTMSDTAVVVVPPQRPGTGPDAEAAVTGTAAGTPAVVVAALAALVVTAALNVPEMFAYGPGIKPSAAGLPLLLDLIVDASLLAALVLTAGAVTSGSRALLVGASVLSGSLALVLLITRAGGGTADLTAALPFVALALSLAVAWTLERRAESNGARLRWVAVLPLVLAASPLQVLADPAAVSHYFGDPTLAPLHLLPIMLFGVGPVLAAALLGFPRRGTRVAAAVLLGLLALAGIAATLESASGLRLLVTLNLLRAGGYALACALVVSAALAPRTDR